ncbi:hypothetical protein ABZY19_22070 [Streptomyces sp. NPDC006475]|uniref:hypothetical protein n=1 Tax=Streptomyces sp. NPDC006475 TaxID=3155719 RepID=UPI0033A82824
MANISKPDRARCLSATAAMAVALSAGAAFAPLATADGPAVTERARTFELVGKQTSAGVVKVGKSGTSVGDQNVVHEDLYRDGKRVGDHSAVCTVT